MYPLIEIKTVPIEIKMKTTNASLEYVRGTAEMELSRSDSGDLNIKSRPIKVDLDSFKPRGGGNMPRGVAQPAGSGGAQTYQATATYARQGQELMLDARLNQQNLAAQVPQGITVQQMSANTVETLPQTKGDELADGSMEIRYEMDKLNFDWKIDQGEFKFTPGDIEITVEQQPSVTIKYVGGPIYVPPSSDPNYEPVDVKA